MTETIGEKIKDSIFIFGAKEERWICATKKDAIENVKNHLKTKVKPDELCILELKQEDNEWRISEIGWNEIIGELF